MRSTPCATPECETDVTQVRYNLIRRSINTIFYYWKRIMPPSITTGVMAMVDARLRVSMEKLAETDASPPALVDEWWAEAQLNTCKGGLGDSDSDVETQTDTGRG